MCLVCGSVLISSCPELRGSTMYVQVHTHVHEPMMQPWVLHFGEVKCSAFMDLGESLSVWSYCDVV